MFQDIVIRAVITVPLIVAGALLLWMAHAGATGKLERNPLAGIRTPATLSSDAAWRPAHVRAERPTRWAGYVTLATAAALWLPLPTDLLPLVVLPGVLVMLALVVSGAVVGSRAARQVRD